MSLSALHESKDVILIADDNEQTTDFIKLLIESIGLACIVADNGQKTVDIVKSQHVDLVLLDIVMPDVDGITIAKTIKEIVKDEFLPIILVTALSAREDKITGLSCADDYITKPFASDELIARIKSLLRIRRLHRELSQSKLRFESLYENFPHLYISLDPDNKITDCNRFFRQTFNVTKTDIVNRSIFDFISKDEHALLDNFIKSLPYPVSVRQRVFKFIKPNPSDIIYVNFKAVYIGDKSTGQWTVIAMEDVTQQLKIQEEQKIARKHLYKSARLASIGTLASGVAHEMNNPLTAILGFSSAILDRINNKEQLDLPELDQYLQIINREALRCRDIVENLSRFAREGGDCYATSVSLFACVNDAIKLVNAKLNKANIAVENLIQEDCTIIAEANKVEQIFVNILTNSIDFCGNDSSIKIVPANSRDSNRFVGVHVIDNGPGIDAAVLPKVFDPFFTTKEVGRGTGMGLAICHRIMEELNGSIDILSEAGTGTRVILEFQKNK